jgi:hypothetical protein
LLLLLAAAAAAAVSPEGTAAPLSMCSRDSRVERLENEELELMVRVRQFWYYSTSTAKANWYSTSSTVLLLVLPVLLVLRGTVVVALDP